MWFRKQRALTVFQYCRDCWTQRERLPVAQRRIWCKGSCLWCPSACWCLKADRMRCVGNPWNCDVFRRKISRAESIRSVAWNTPPRCIRPFVQRWNGGPLALSIPKAGCPSHGSRRALQLSAWCLVARKGTTQDGTFTCGFPYHADSHLQCWESGVSPVNGVEHVTPINFTSFVDDISLAVACFFLLPVVPRKKWYQIQ